MARDQDETVRLRPRQSSRRLFLGCAVCAGAAAIGGGAWLLSRHSDTPTTAAKAAPIVTASEAMILANRPADIDCFRFDRNPNVIVLDFASLHRQGAMLNRIAAMIEKNGAPHDRVLDDTSLARAIAASGTTADTFYYGHDYGTLELSRFFTAADQAGLALSADEQWLRRLVTTQHGLEAGARIGVISLPAATGDVTVEMRRTILHHELSHGEFFTNPAYADWAHSFWTQRLDSAGRDIFRKFLVSEGYDPQLETLLVNETQAYLMFTPSPSFFSASLLGVDEATLAAWRAQFRAGMPAGWLRETAEREAG